MEGSARLLIKYCDVEEEWVTIRTDTEVRAAMEEAISEKGRTHL